MRRRTSALKRPFRSLVEKKRKTRARTEPEFFLLNGAFTSPENVKGWTDLWEWRLQDLGYTVTSREYYIGLLSRLWKEKGIVDGTIEKLKLIRKPIIFIGHSFAGEILSGIVKKSDVKFSQVHLFGPACSCDFQKNGFDAALVDGRIKQMNVYCSDADEVLDKWARRSIFLKPFGLHYGTLGFDGPDESTLSGDASKHLSVVREGDYQHSDWVRGKRSEKYFERILNQATTTK